MAEMSYRVLPIPNQVADYARYPDRDHPNSELSDRTGAPERVRSGVAQAPGKPFSGGIMTSNGQFSTASAVQHHLHGSRADVSHLPATDLRHALTAYQRDIW